MKKSSILIAGSLSVASLTAAVARAETVTSIVVEGAARTSAEFVRSHITIWPNVEFAGSDIDDSIRQLYALGQFKNVRITVARKELVVVVEENKLINQVVFNGNQKIKDDNLALIVKTKPTGPYDEAQIKSDIEAIKQAYAATGRTDVDVGIKTMVLSPDYVNVAFTINEGEKTKIDSINFIGNSAFSAERLSSVIGLKKSNLLSFLTRKDVFLEEKLEADKKALANFYTTHGFADFEVLSAEAHFDPSDKSYALTFTLNEGPLYSFGKVAVLSNINGLPDGELEKALRTKQGERYNADRVETSVESLTNVAASQGFPFAKVTPRATHNLADNTISLEYQIDQGEKSYIERIVIRGNTRTRDYVIRREFDVSEGDPYNRQMIEASKRRLEALGFFKSVDITATQGSAADRVVLTVDVEDSSTGSFGIGAGASSDGPVLEASVEENNFLGRGQYIKLAASGGWDDDDSRNYSLAFTEPYFLGYHLAAGFDLNYSETSYDDYDLDQAGLSLRVTAPINEQLASTFRYNLTYLDYGGDSSDLSATYQHLIDDGPWVRSSVSNTLTFNSLDSVKQPRSGIYATLTEEFAGLGGDSQYFKVTGKLRYYELLAEDADVIGSLTLGGGQIFAFGSSLNTFDQFSLGGNEIRGFAKRGIGARIADADDQTLGGSSYFYGSAEVSFPLPAVPRDAGFRGTFFADAGTLFANRVQVLGSDVVEGDNGSLRASVGVGLVWDSPFGALRVDYALPLAYEESDELERFKIGVNSAF
ncbi:outer membrane protein assembly factor BamA [Rhizobium mongolense]|uniref:Outer membrane protein assembly factor BamA n=2 Tax=Rhizobium mongolense TaxID=57676 RepID=A0ABR6IQG2_9HYPH|nr:outer membrane protein assembly factor BamA [Rhizobium mongolense]MBB4230121.1 outer membrane protein insertion porin family [Rhizobium mongolense]TVZ65790.1 Beta-barrel assembly machine subunit BamA [Rhizobium mongolense USDA 1844]